MLLDLRQSVASLLGGPRRVVLAAIAAAAAAGAAVAVTARGRQRALALPDPGPLAAEAATSVHNAAKGTVISRVRASSDVDGELVLGVVRDAMVDASQSGVDLISAAIGVVEGAGEIAHLVGRPRDEVVRDAAGIAAEVATERGRTAGDRVRTVLAPILGA